MESNYNYNKNNHSNQNNDNNSSFNDIIGKFNDILKSKDIDLGKILNDEPEDNPLDFNFDLDTIIKFKNIFGQINNKNSPRNKLLYSLKPFLRDSRKQKLEEYIRIANLLGALTLLNETNNKE